MMRGMYAAISGLNVHQTMLDVTASNLANVDTIGYKGQRTTFVDQLAQEIRSATAPTATSGGSNPIQIGLGVELGSIDNLMNEGSMQSTGNVLDLGIQGDGFFQVLSGDPTQPIAAGAQPQYTRAGNFTLNSQGYLMTQSGEYVLGQTQAGNIMTGTPPAVDTTKLTYIKIPPGSTAVAIGQDGQVSYTPPPGTPPPTTPTYISLATFPNPAGLQRAVGSLWQQSDSSGSPMEVGNPTTDNLGQTISGELEQSNVDLATEFTNMITAERGFQANSRVITTADQMLQTVVQMGQ